MPEGTIPEGAVSGGPLPEGTISGGGCNGEDHTGGDNIGRAGGSLRQSGEHLPESRCCVEEKCRTVPVVPLFL